MDILNFSANEFKIFILILIRVSIVLFMFPVFSSPVVPGLTKIALALILSLLLYPVVPMDPGLFPQNNLGFAVLITGEFIVGMVMGYTVDIFFGAVQLAGQIIGFQMGFSMINVIDPQSGANISMMSQIGYLVAILLFILLNGHHTIIQALVESFRIVNMGEFFLKAGMITQLQTMVTGMFVLGIKMAAPAMAALLFTSAAFGICAKFVPQMNIMIVAFPVQIYVGLITFGLTLQVIGILSNNFTGTFRGLLSSLLLWMGG
ncbi:MAG: flagellar biosynthetic protein FliR [Proteobacteria bacterium]|nr:flagellar biosynthetic protein FliR [Pseudomonadota bacterium]